MPHGWLILDKPLGLTSTQALGRARRLMGGKKVGHGGTLDPLATGVLPLAFGEATKLIPFAMDGEKTYEFGIRWGESRTTDDAEGPIVSRSDIRPTESQIRDLLHEFIGNILQKPPTFSAIQIQGQRAYALARAGKTVDLAAREVRVDNLELLEIIDKDSASFRVKCGKGFYVRSITRDIAEKLGTFGYVNALRRTKVGPFTLENAVSMEDLESLNAKNAVFTALLPLKAALGDSKPLVLTELEAECLRSGKRIPLTHCNFKNTGVFLAEYDGIPVALAEVVDNEIRVVRGFHF